MLSYVHAFHAGNYGDILKHTVFFHTLSHLLKKDKAFCVLDTHSGSGRYLLNDQRLLKTGEAQQGIQKLLKAPEEELKTIFGTSFLSILKEYSDKGFYPGSPEIARTVLRKKDILLLNELHPAVFEELKTNIHSPLLATLPEKTVLPSITLSREDAAVFLNRSVPPAVKRGCVIIDPSYEDAEDYRNTALMFSKAWKKWSSASWLIWYPLLSRRKDEIEALKQTVTDTVESTNSTQDKKSVFFEIQIRDESSLTGLSSMYGSGMLAVNPVYGLTEKMAQALPLMEKYLR